VENVKRRNQLGDVGGTCSNRQGSEKCACPQEAQRFSPSGRRAATWLYCGRLYKSECRSLGSDHVSVVGTADAHPVCRTAVRRILNCLQTCAERCTGGPVTVEWYVFIRIWRATSFEKINSPLFKTCYTTFLEYFPKTTTAVMVLRYFGLFQICKNKWKELFLVINDTSGCRL
jgi:hypothetical protein